MAMPEGQRGCPTREPAHQRVAGNKKGDVSTRARAGWHRAGNRFYAMTDVPASPVSITSANVTQPGLNRRSV
jgi:hypothetical protein